MRQRTEALRKHLAKAAGEAADIAADSRLSVDGRAAKLAPIQERFAVGVQKLREENASDVKHAQDRVSSYLPHAKRREAALRAPERAAAIRLLAATLPFEELLDMAQRDGQKDHVLAYALTGIDDARSAKLKPEQRDALAKALAFVPTGESAGALADFIVSRIEASRFEAVAAEGLDGRSRNPDARLQAAFDATTIVLDGEARTFAEHEVEGFYEHIEMPRPFADLEDTLRIPDSPGGRMLAAFAGSPS